MRRKDAKLEKTKDAPTRYMQKNKTKDSSKESRK